MADQQKKTGPTQPLSEDILRKMAASGKSLPPVKLSSRKENEGINDEDR